ncbi:hypothetical protein [Acidianus brierleyi]|uniref:hypothetical protein n=1 Tax=Acidianus brierleyi TaxID=41673 RepID=UPI001443057B|nr:hypothetical protein [Acidianus brierleyi]
MNIIEEILLVLGIVMMPYGLYEVAKGNGDKQVKIILITISLALFATEFFLAYR